MTLSVCIVTRDSAGYIRALLEVARSFADEVVVAVDASSQDDTESVCRAFADRLFRLEPFGDAVEVTLGWLIDQCRGDWILRLDDDELPSLGLVRSLPKLMADREFTHYWLRRRWLAPPDGQRWFSGSAWWPDWQLRLFRNIRSLVHVPGRVHTSYRVLGDGRYLVDGSIYHLDHVLHSADHRRQKAERYERIAPGDPNWDQYVLPADQHLPTRPVPAEDPPHQVWAPPPPQLCDSPALQVPKDELRRGWLLEAGGAADPADLFQARISCDGLPAEMHAGQPLILTVELTNLSASIWRRFDSAEQPVRVSYHWFDRQGGTVVWDGVRAELPQTLRPGQSAFMPVWVLPPRTPGDYVLEWDLVVETVAWFSSQGWSPPCSHVRVQLAPTPLSARAVRRFVLATGVGEAELDSPSARFAQMHATQQDDELASEKVPPLAFGKVEGAAWMRGRGDPRVSVLMCVYNNVAYFPAALESILGQTFADFELLVVDDGSDDGTQELVERATRDPRVRVFRQPNQGVARACNMVSGYARAELVAIMDGDDVARPGRLAAEVSYLDGHPECVLVGSRVTLIDANGLELAAGARDPHVKLTHEEIDLALLTGGWPIVTPSVVMRAQAVRAVGGYCEDFRVSSDHDLFLKLAEVGQLANLPTVQLHYRRHPASATGSKSELGARCVQQAISRAVERRFAPAPRLPLGAARDRVTPL